MMEAIKTKNLTKYYGKTKGIKNLNITVESLLMVNTEKKIFNNIQYRYCLDIMSIIYSNLLPDKSMKTKSKIK